MFFLSPLIWDKEIKSYENTKESNNSKIVKYQYRTASFYASL